MQIETTVHSGAKLDWAQASGSLWRLGKAYTKGMLGSLLVTGTANVLSMLLVAPFVYLNVQFLIGAGKGAGHAGGEMVLLLLAPSMALVAVFCVFFPFLGFMTAQKRGLASAFYSLVVVDQVPVVRWVVGEMAEFLDGLAPGKWFLGAQMQQAWVKEAVTKLENSPSQPKLVRRVLKHFVRKVDLGRVISQQDNHQAEVWTREEWLQKTEKRLESLLAEKLKPSSGGMILLAFVNVVAAISIWALFLL